MDLVKREKENILSYTYMLLRDSKRAHHVMH